jgi:hypothetical protein
MLSPKRPVFGRLVKALSIIHAKRADMTPGHKK